MKFGSGLAACSNSYDAGRRAAAAALQQAGDPAIVLPFTTDCHDHEAVLAGIQSVVSNTPLVGCCVGGIIMNDEVIMDGVGVCLLSGPEISAVTALAGGLSGDPWAAGERLGKDLIADGDTPGIVFLYPDGFSANISRTIQGVYDVLGPEFKYAGGGTGDNLKFATTVQFTERGVRSDSIAGALIRGIPFGTAVGHGWQPLGEPLLVSRAAGKRVLEIDGLPAFDAYRERIGPITPQQFAEHGMLHPLGFPDVAGHYLIRDPIAVNDDRSLEFVTEVPRNALGYLMQCDVAELITISGQVASQAAAQVRKPAFALVFDCISRYLLMKEKPKRKFVRFLVAVKLILLDY